MEGDEKELWGTREELLLAGAVGRHGLQRWDSVAMEMQRRTPSPAFFTPETCEKRFLSLRRRFRLGDDDADVILLLEELRKLRVAELRRDLERSDVSILSLQLKVKELTEERDRSNSRSSNESNFPGQKNSDSYNGSSDTVPAGQGDEPPAENDSGESMAESKGDDFSPPWASFLETLRSSELGPTFERRLPSQETAEYEGLIRQHMDLDMVRRKMEEGIYEGEAEFYRDLMLISTNAVVFFATDSPEHAVGVGLRRLVLERTRGIAPSHRIQSFAAADVEEEEHPPPPEPEETASAGKLPEEEEEEDEVEENGPADAEMIEKAVAVPVPAVRRTRTGGGRRKPAQKRRAPPAPPPAANEAETKNAATAKKKSAVNFLSRINKAKAEEISKKAAAGRGKKGDGESVPLKRGVGRPPKRPPPPPPAAELAKKKKRGRR